MIKIKYIYEVITHLLIGNHSYQFYPFTILILNLFCIKSSLHSTCELALITSGSL